MLCKYASYVSIDSCFTQWLISNYLNTHVLTFPFLVNLSKSVTVRATKDLNRTHAAYVDEQFSFKMWRISLKVFLLQGELTPGSSLVQL